MSLQPQTNHISQNYYIFLYEHQRSKEIHNETTQPRNSNTAVANPNSMRSPQDQEPVIIKPRNHTQRLIISFLIYVLPVPSTKNTAIYEATSIRNILVINTYLIPYIENCVQKGFYCSFEFLQNHHYPTTPTGKLMNET